MSRQDKPTEWFSVKNASVARLELMSCNIFQKETGKLLATSLKFKKWIEEKYLIIVLYWNIYIIVQL